MTHQLSAKTVACLELAELVPGPFEAWHAAYEEACAKYSEKAVVAKLHHLANRGLVEYGVSARMGWLTEDGQEALARSRGD